MLRKTACFFRKIVYASRLMTLCGAAYSDTAYSGTADIRPYIIYSVRSEGIRSFIPKVAKV